MRPQLLVLAILLLGAVPLAFTQQVNANIRTVQPPQIQQAVAQPGTQVNEALADVLDLKPQMPRGPVEILRDYESQMTLVSQTFSAEMGVITQAVHQGQITRAQADYLMQQRFQIAIMEYEVLNGLHDSLAFDISRTPVSSHSQAPAADTTIVVQPPVPVPLGSSELAPN